MSLKGKINSYRFSCDSRIYELGKLWRINVCRLPLSFSSFNLTESLKPPPNLDFKCCGLPKHLNLPFTMITRREHKASHSSMLCEVRMAMRFSPTKLAMSFQRGGVAPARPRHSSARPGRLPRDFPRGQSLWRVCAYCRLTSRRTGDRRMR